MSAQRQRHRAKSGQGAPAFDVAGPEAAGLRFETAALAAEPVPAELFGAAIEGARHVMAEPGRSDVEVTVLGLRAVAAVYPDWFARAEAEPNLMAPILRRAQAVGLRMLALFDLMDAGQLDRYKTADGTVPWAVFHAAAAAQLLFDAEEHPRFQLLDFAARVAALERGA